MHNTNNWLGNGNCIARPCLNSHVCMNDFLVTLLNLINRSHELIAFGNALLQTLTRSRCLHLFQAKPCRFGRHLVTGHIVKDANMTIAGGQEVFAQWIEQQRCNRRVIYVFNDGITAAVQSGKHFNGASSCDGYDLTGRWKSNQWRICSRCGILGSNKAAWRLSLLIRNWGTESQNIGIIINITLTFRVKELPGGVLRDGCNMRSVLIECHIVNARIMTTQIEHVLSLQVLPRLIKFHFPNFDVRRKP